MQASLWGLDLGGTKLEGVILPSLLQPTPILRQRIDTESFKGYEHIIGQIERLIREMKEASGLSPRAVGIGTPGVLDPVLQTMKNCNTTVLNGKPFQKDLEEKLQLPVILANDAILIFSSQSHIKEYQGTRIFVFSITVLLRLHRMWPLCSRQRRSAKARAYSHPRASICLQCMQSHLCDVLSPSRTQADPQR